MNPYDLRKAIITQYEETQAEILAQRTIAQQAAKMHVYLQLKKRNLPIPPDLKKECEASYLGR